MKKEEIIKILKEVNDEVEQHYKAKIKGIFGSLVKGEETDKSDLDVLVEFKEGANLLHLVGLSLFLEEKIGLPIDLVPLDTIRDEIKHHIQKEAVYL